MATEVTTALHHLLNLDGLARIIEQAYREGFRNGDDHGNLEYKYPPAYIAWLRFKQANGHLLQGGILTREELLAVKAWEDASYPKRIAGKLMGEDE